MKGNEEVVSTVLFIEIGESFFQGSPLATFYRFFLYWYLLSIHW